MSESVKEIVQRVETRAGYQRPLAFGVGIVKRNAKGAPLEVYYAALYRDACHELAAFLADAVGHLNGNSAYPLTSESLRRAAALLASCPDGEKNAPLLNRLAESEQPIVVTFITADEKPASLEETYLKLSLLSHQMAKPRELNLNGIIDLLPTVAWTSEGAVDIDELPERQLEARIRGVVLEVYAVDKFPTMVNHIVPQGVRITDGLRVRLGAHLGPGTTVMAEGFVNYNAGTAGPNMVDGRIQGGVFVDSGSDLGGASSIMGSLYGEQRRFVAVGRDCIIGANAGTGIALGDECTIEAGLYVTAGTKVELLDKTGKKVGTVKARDLSGKSNLLFRRNSSTGQVEALESSATVLRNEALSRNN